MQLSDEIREIRQELFGVERSVARLRLRVDGIEARHQATERDARREQAAPVHDDSPETPRATAIAPPPLPTATRRIAGEVRPPISTAPTVVQATVEGVRPGINQTVTRGPAPVPRVKRPRRFGPPEGMSFEMALGSYWLPRIGMLLVAIGLVWFLSYANQQFHDAPWMPWARVGSGYLLSVGLVAIGRMLESKYTNYARILMGGGCGLTYFVTFATWYIPQTRIAPSQEFTLLLLGLLVLGAGALAEWRKSQPIAFTMTLLGHFTVALSTLSLTDPSRAAVGGLLLLGLGSAWFLVRHGWYTVAMTAMVGSYVNQYLWLSRSPASDTFGDFVVGMAVLAAYLLTYALAELFTPPAKRTVPPRIRTLFVTVNTSGYVLLGLGLVQDFSITPAYDHLHYFVTALFALVMGGSYLYRAGKDHLSNDRVTATYLTKASVLVAVGFATWLEGNTLTLSLGLESLVLLLLARYRKEHAGRILALGSAGLAFAHGIYTVLTMHFPLHGDAGFIGEVMVALMIVTAFVIFAEIYRVTPWHRFAAPGFPTMPTLNALCHRLEMMPADYAGGPRPSRLHLAQALAMAGAVLLCVYSVVLFTLSTTVLAMGVSLLLMGAVALYRASAPLLSGVALLALLHVGATVDYLHHGDAISMAVVALGSIAPLLLLAEALCVVLPRQLAHYACHDDIQGAWYRNNQLVAYVVSGAAALLVFVLGETHLDMNGGMLLGGILALGATVYATCMGSRTLGLFALCMVLFTGVFNLLDESASPQPWYAVAGLVLAMLAATAVEARWWGEGKGLTLHRLLPTPYLVYGAVAWGGASLMVLTLNHSIEALALVALAVFFGGSMAVLHQRAMAIFGTLLTLLAFVLWRTNVLPGTAETSFHLTAVALLGAAVGGDRLFAHYRPFAKPILGRTLLIVAWLTCYRYNELLNRSIWYYVGLAAIAAVFLVYGGYFRSRTAAGLSLLAAGIGTGAMIFLPMDDSALLGFIVAYASLIAYWLCTERGAVMVLDRTRLPLMPGHRPMLNATLTGIPTLLGIVAVTHMDLIHDFYLTIAWTLWALALFAWALGTRQAWFRYMALLTLGLAIGRAFLIDVWQLQALYRVGAMIFLGITLLGIAFGYTRWRANEEHASNPSPKPDEVSHD